MLVEALISVSINREMQFLLGYIESPMWQIAWVGGKVIQK